MLRFLLFLSGQGPRDSAGLAHAENKANQIFNLIHQSVAKYPDKAEIALNPDDAYRLEKEGKRAIYIGIENGYALGNKIENIDHFYQLGARYITLCHTHNNDICDSSTDSTEFNGLSDFGVKVVERMNQLGIMVDVSHISDSSFYNVLKVTKAPVIASHSCSRAICDNRRNLTDDMLLALAKNGGVVQMCILSDYVKKITPSPERDSALRDLNARSVGWEQFTDAKRKQLMEEWNLLDVKYPPVLATVSDMADHIDHMVKVAGIDHVGIGTDFDGGGSLQGLHRCCTNGKYYPRIV